MPAELPKQYDPKEAQQRWLQFWNERGYFIIRAASEAEARDKAIRRRRS